MITDTSWLFIRLYNQYKSGVLPYAGGFLQQPNGFVQAVEVIERALRDER